eukprot:UN05862
MSDSNSPSKLRLFYKKAKESISKYMEPEPVLFEANPDKSVSAFCKHPEIKTRDADQPFRHSPNYNPTLSPALQRLFNENYAKNKENKDKIVKKINFTL